MDFNKLNKEIAALRKVRPPPRASRQQPWPRTAVAVQ